jgi:hypothetical protein
MAVCKKINNKVKLSKFWAMGGRCRIELWPDLPYHFGEPWLLGARSIEEMKDVRKRIEELSNKGSMMCGKVITANSLVCSVSFLLDNFFYEYYGYVWDLENDDYLHIKERVYK